MWPMPTLDAKVNSGTCLDKHSVISLMPSFCKM